MNFDHAYTEKQKYKEATTRTLIVLVRFKHNNGHLGTEIVFLGTHVHNMTAKNTWTQVLTQYWDDTHARVRKYGITFIAGDLNMCFTDACNQLRSRGLDVDLIAWPPFHILKK